MGAVTTRVSSFGRINTTFYSLLKFLEERDGHNLEICDFGCLDGLHTIPFLKKGHIVDGFDMNDVYLYGGHIQLPIVKENGQIILQRRTMYGAEDRINIENLFDRVRLYNKNIFDCCDRKYDVVYSKRGLSRTEYSKYKDCLHFNEPYESCLVKQGVASGFVNRNRYESYLRILGSLLNEKPNLELDDFLPDEKKKTNSRQR